MFIFSFNQVHTTWAISRKKIRVQPIGVFANSNTLTLRFGKQPENLLSSFTAEEGTVLLGTYEGVTYAWSLVPTHTHTHIDTHTLQSTSS